MKKNALTVISILLVCLFAMPIFAQEIVGDPSYQIPRATVNSETMNDSIPSSDYGTGNWIEMNVGSMGFSPLSDGEWSHFGSGWSYRSGGANSATCISPRFPNGAALYGLTRWTTDNDATYNISYDFWGVDLVDNTRDDIYSWTSTGTPGTQKMFVNFPGGPITVNADRYAYYLCVFSDTTGTSLQHSGVTLWYQLQVSPAPATASFSDVPTSHPFFRYVEALFDAGITAGCGSGNYCPDAPLTRGQMAVFLSRALGLYWQYF